MREAAGLRWRKRESNEGSALYPRLPTPASPRPLEAAVGPAEPQKGFCQAALIIRIARSESLLWGPQPAMVPTRRGNGRKRTFAPSAEVHGHDRQALRPTKVFTVAHIHWRVRHDDARVPLSGNRRA